MRRRVLAAALVLAAAFGRASGAAEAIPTPASEPDRFLAARVAAVVNVRAVVKIHASMGGQSFEQEKKVTALGTVVDPSGLVVLANMALGGDVGGAFELLRQLGIELTTSAREIKVQVGGEGSERDAVLVARDGTLGLAFVQLLGDAGRPFAAVDLSAGAEPTIGARIYAVARKTRGFDHVPLLLRLYASSKIERPRPMWSIEGDYEAAGYAQLEGGGLFGGNRFVGGTPAFDAAGRPVGFLSSQPGSVGESMDAFEADDVLLPTAVVAKTIEAAKKRVADAVAQATATADPEGK